MEVVFTADPGFIGKSIRYFTKRSWIKSARTSHVALRFSGEESKWMVEANEHGFMPNWWPKFIQIRSVYRRYKVKGIDENILRQVIDSCIDEFILDKYDILGFLGMGIIVIWYWITGQKIKNFFGRKSALTCSEVTYRIFEKVKEETGIEFFEERNPETVFPEELLIECENKTDLFEIIE